MTDYKIKKEIEKWKTNLLTVKTEERFADLVGWSAQDRSCVIGFYAGFRTAERLAKIEVLEEVCKEIDSLELPRRAINAVTRILDELKPTK